MEPKISISVLVDYLMAPTASGRRRILKTAKTTLGKQYFAPYYGVARHTLRSHHSGNALILPTTIASLRSELKEAKKPQHRARIENNLRVLSDYRDKFSDTVLEHVGRRFQASPVGGILVSSEPTLSGVLVERGRRFSTNVIVECDEVSPIQRMADYTTELIYRACGATYETDPRGAQLWHPGSGAQWYLKKHLASRWREIEAACEEIAAIWPGI